MDGQTTNPLQAGMTQLTPASALDLMFDKDTAAPAPAAQDAPRPQRQPQVSAPEADAAPAETQPSGETEGSDEPAEGPPIEAPPFWKKSAKEFFDSLPRHIQEQVVERERERDTEVRRVQNEVAEKRKTFESETLAAQTERQRYQQQLQTFVPALQQQLQGKWAGVDWPKLARENPAEYVALQAEYQADAGKLQRAAFEHKRTIDAQQEADRKARDDAAKAEWTALTEKKPELADKTKAEAWFKDVNAYALESGYTQEQIASNALHINFLVLEKAMLYDRALKAKADAVVRDVPKVQTPGAARTKSDRAAADRDALQKRAEKTGDLRDWSRTILMR